MVTIHLLFFNENSNEFYMQSYIHNSYSWSCTLDGQSINIYKNTFASCDKVLASARDYSKLPCSVNILFHSLSPFDRIHTLIKLKLNSSPAEAEHYKKRLKYIGVKKILEDEIDYEYMTIINLLNLFFHDTSNSMINSLGYEFKNVQIEINDNYFQELKIPRFVDFNESQQETLTKYISEENYNQLDIYLKYPSIQNIDENFINAILLSNLMLSDKDIFVQFLTLVVEKNKEFDDISILIGEELKNLQKYIEYKEFFDVSRYDFLIAIIENKEKIFQLTDLTSNDTLEVLVSNSEIYYLLKILKVLTVRNILKFSLNIQKNNLDIDFIRLSSGEKTLLSYFANISAKVNELIEIQGEDTELKNIQSRTFLVLIDEVELHLHPEWQRNFIKHMDDFFNYGELGIKLQFIIATHSPFVVTDVFHQNIIYLGDTAQNQTQTFGGNIFDIFKDDFYVSNTIGAFSENIIKELSEFLYFLLIVKRAKEDRNFFMLRDFFDLMYESDDKETENIQLLEQLETLEDDKFNKIKVNKYLEIYTIDESGFFEMARKIAANIGEDITKNHLLKLMDDIGVRF